MSFDKQLGDAKDFLYADKYDVRVKDDHQTLLPFKLWNLTLKCNPKKDLAMSHNRSMNHKWKFENGAYPTFEKTLTKLDMKEKDVSVNVEAANDRWAVKLAKPLLTDDWKVNSSVRAEGYPGTSIKGEVTFDVKSPDMSGNALNVYMQADVTNKFHKAVAAVAKTESKPAVAAKAAEWKNDAPHVKMHFNLVNDKQNHIGAMVEYQDKLTTAEVGLARHQDGNVFWGGYHHVSEYVKMGAMFHDQGRNWHHGYEVRYWWNKKNLAFGTGAKLVASGKCKMSDKSSMSYMVEQAEKVHCIGKYTHKIDKNWTGTVKQQYDMHNNDKPYALGFDVSYQI